jgi:hypothetical protein
MSFRITLEEDQLKDLAILRDLEPVSVGEILKLLTASCDLIRPSELIKVIQQAIPEIGTESNLLVKLMISLNTLRRQRSLKTSELLEGLSDGIKSGKAKWTNDEIHRWNERLPDIEILLFHPVVQTVVKALDLSYDYANLFQSATILTDIRPIFDETSTKIDGSVISFTLRLYYDGFEGSKNISIALDIDDINKLIYNCEKALMKAEASKMFMLNNNICKTFVAGENDDEES